jgi:hypothetical protein
MHEMAGRNGIAHSHDLVDQVDAAIMKALANNPFSLVRELS